jgi:hypothetical protein
VSLDEKLQAGQKAATSLWLLGAMAVAVFSAGWSAHVYVTRNVVRYGDPISISTANDAQKRFFFEVCTAEDCLEVSSEKQIFSDVFTRLNGSETTFTISKR